MTDRVTLDTRVLDNLIKTAPNRISAILRTSVFAIVGDAKIRAPVATGALRNSIDAEEKNKLLWHIHDGVEYGIFQELGTSRMRAQPFLTPAVMAEEQHFLGAFKELENTA